jgi:hypothetical protein
VTDTTESSAYYSGWRIFWISVIWVSVAAIIVGFILVSVIPMPSDLRCTGTEEGCYAVDAKTPPLLALGYFLAIASPFAIIPAIVAAGHFRRKRDHARVSELPEPTTKPTVTVLPAASRPAATRQPSSSSSGRGNMSRMEFRAFERRVTGYKRGRNRGPRPF